MYSTLMHRALATYAEHGPSLSTAQTGLILLALMSPEPLTIDAQRTLVCSASRSIRQALAERADLSPEVVQQLATDPNARVRTAARRHRDRAAARTHRATNHSPVMAAASP